MRESDLYPPLKRHYEAQGYAVYAEVPAPHGGYVDLLGVRGGEWLAVELKPHFSREAVRQAGRNRRFVWESYVAVPAGARTPARRTAVLKRHGAGLLAVTESGIVTAIAARHTAPPCTLREAFGRHLEGQLAGFYAAAQGGVPTVERASASQELLRRVKAALAARGGIANTSDLFADTLAWNYCRSQRGGLVWLLRNNFRSLASDLWAMAKTRTPRRFVIDGSCLVRTHLADTFVCLPDPGIAPLPGDYVNRVRVISAARHPIVETPQRELRCGGAVFFPWRCPADVPLPRQSLVLRIDP